jgi:hypothetical protein
MHADRFELRDRVAFSIESFARAHDIGRTKTLQQIRSGKLIARKIGTRTIITVEDARVWRESLPTAEPDARVKREEPERAVLKAKPTQPEKREPLMPRAPRPAE